MSINAVALSSSRDASCVVTEIEAFGGIYVGAYWCVKILRQRRTGNQLHLAEYLLSDMDLEGPIKGSAETVVISC